MSFVPAPQQANAANATNNQNAGQVTTLPSAAAGAASAAAVPELTDQELLFKMRTFDVYWVEKHALMYRDGIAKVREATGS